MYSACTLYNRTLLFSTEKPSFNRYITKLAIMIYSCRSSLSNSFTYEHDKYPPKFSVHRHRLNHEVHLERIPNVQHSQ
jgi:hypothetical protein